MNPYVLLTVALISMLLNVYYMGRVWALKKLFHLTKTHTEVTYRLGFKFYVLYMNAKLNGEIPQEHLARSYESIVVDESVKAEVDKW